MRPGDVCTNRMTHNATLAGMLVLVTALVVAPVAAAVPSSGPGATFATQETAAQNDSSVAPGEKLSGVVSVQSAEIEGEVAERTYGVRVAQANSNASKAAVVADTVDDVEGRVDELRQRKATLEAARENGSMSEGEYRAKMATVATKLSTARRLANASEDTAQGLPESVLAEKGINVTAIQALQDRAGNLTGPEVAKIARSIAGKDVGTSMAGNGPPDDAGPPDDGGPPNRSDSGSTDAGGPPNSTGS